MLLWVHGSGNIWVESEIKLTATHYAPRFAGNPREARQHTAGRSEWACMRPCVCVCVCFEFAEMNWYLINSFTLINPPFAPPPPLMPHSEAVQARSSPNRFANLPRPKSNYDESLPHVDLMKLPYNCCSDVAHWGSRVVWVAKGAGTDLAGAANRRRARKSNWN